MKSRIVSILSTVLIAGIIHIAFDSNICDADEQYQSESERENIVGSEGELLEDGSISNYVRPSSIKHPLRWRYIPPKRIVSGSIFERFLISSFIAPIIFRDSDVGTGGGIALTDIDFREKRRQEFAGLFLTHTSEGQQRYTFVWRQWLNHLDLPNDGVLLEERNWLTIRGGYERSLTRRFFGIDGKTSKDDETSYTEETFFLGADLQRTLPDAADDLVLSGGIRLASHRLFDGRVSDVPSTIESFPELFAEADTRDIAWVKLAARWDTRDSQVNPYQGWASGIESRHALVQNGAGYGALFRAFGTFVQSLPPLFYHTPESSEENPPTDTLAFILEGETSTGELPFFALPALGGSDRQRGYIRNRWSADSLWFSALEYRFWLMPRGFRISDRVRIERLGLATFYELGGVSTKLSDLHQASILQSYGVGLRFTLERSAPFRIDLGFSEEDTELVIRFGLSF